MQPTRVGIRDAKMHLSKFIKMVQNGNEVIITDRGRPVGKIVPVRPEELSLSVRIKKLEDMGLLEALPQKKRKKLHLPIPVPNDIAQTMLKEDRNNA